MTLTFDGWYDSAAGLYRVRVTEGRYSAGELTLSPEGWTVLQSLMAQPTGGGDE